MSKILRYAYKTVCIFYRCSYLQNQKESYNSQEKTVTIDVSIKVAQNSDVHKEKKKERSKRRSEKRTLVGLPMPKQQPSLLPTEVKNNALNNITANVYHTKLKQTSPMVNTVPNRNCLQLLHQVEASDSQESFVEQNSSMQALPDTQVKARPSQSSKNLLQMQDSAQVTAIGKHYLLYGKCHICRLLQRM